jgi:subtilisin family serine protease
LTDDSGHGTAVAGLIHDIAPDAQIIISKVAKAGEVTAWHTLAAILDNTGEHLLNLSLSFGFSEQVCGISGCGRSFPACRSKVFQSVIDHKLIDEPDLLVLAAAGNLPANSVQDSEEGLRYPAKYGKVISIGCIDGNQKVYGYYGKNADDDVHRHLYFVPGGGGSEHIGTSTLGSKTTDQQGTSFSTACASGLLAVHRSNSANRAERDDILDDLRALAKPFSPHDTDKWGNGILKVNA